VSSEKARLVVGKRVQVSKANATFPHQECVVAADPTNPSRLLVAAMYSSEKWGNAKVRGGTFAVRGVAGYHSDDGGETWKSAFERPGDPENDFGDPALAFGPEGSAHFVCMRINMKVQENRHVYVGDPDAGCLEFSRSSDGGKTWGPTTSLPPHTDRPWIAVDSTTGPYRGRLYCLGNLANTWDLFNFPGGDLAKTLQKVSFPKRKGTAFGQSSNVALLTDGSVVLAHDERSPDKTQRPVTTVHLSRDGGETFKAVGHVNTAWTDSQRVTINRLFFPQLAVDPGSKDYRDRLYCVWEDGGDDARILLSCSADRGRRWTAPLVLSEQPADAAGEQDYRALMPSIAVNKNGAVAVSWYDRRGLAPGTSGYTVRLRVSLDGGASWLSSVQLNEKPCQSSVGSLGDTAGLAADVEGRFHPVWIDDRTGTRQVWTATVKVE
jgi:hypothetical protein